MRLYLMTHNIKKITFTVYKLPKIANFFPAAARILFTVLFSPSSERRTLESSILRVVHHGRQRDAVHDGALSVLMTVAREILQEAAEQSRAALGEALVGERGTDPPTPGGVGVMGR